MINQQCYTVTEAIAVLEKHCNPDDVIIFDYICAKDIKKTLSIFYPQISELSKQKIKQIMYLFNHCYFDMQHLNSTISMCLHLNGDIKEEIDVILNRTK